MKLWYEQPATCFEEALPLGNGRLGAMVYAGALEGRFALNEDSLWSGKIGAPQEKKEGAPQALREARALLLAGDYQKAHELLLHSVLCNRLEAYQPLGDLRIVLEEARGAVTDYRRELDIARAVATTTYNVGGKPIIWEAFCSHPDALLAIRVRGGGTVRASLCSPHPHTTVQQEHDVTMRGRCPVSADADYLSTRTPLVYDPEQGNRSIEFMARAHVRREGEDTIILVQATSSVRGGALPPLLDAPWEEMLARHIEDHRALFGRVELSLGEGPHGALSTPDRLEAYQTQPLLDPSLPALLFQYGRYLLIASAREGSNPPHLQGIWNVLRRPPWSSNYTTNINTQMNHWPAGPTALAECLRPLCQMLKGLAKHGEETARDFYECGGWVAHHNVDGHLHTVPMGGWGPTIGTVCYGMWPMGASWLCQHLWDAYAYTLDEQFLREDAYPLMRGAARFLLDFMLEHKGHLVTCPSTSPENSFLIDGHAYSASWASTMDMALARDLFAHMLSAQDVLSLEDDIRPEIEAAIARLWPYQIGREGQLLEWCEDYEEAEVHHRHVSHLLGLYPGHSISLRDTPELAAACKASLLRRGDEGTGWSIGWKVALWAHLKDGDHALGLLIRQLRPALDDARGQRGGAYPNLLGAHPPFQIDGNFGAAAGIAEMLLQSTQIAQAELLPALPTAWANGKVRGLCAKGAFSVDMAWEAGRLTAAILHPLRDGAATVRYQEQTWQLALRAGQALYYTPDAQWGAKKEEPLAQFLKGE